MQWYAVNTKPNQEAHVEFNLSRLKIQTFCPQIRCRKMIRRRLRTVTGPLFPGYLFAKFDIGEYLRSISFARGVRKVVTFGDTPAVIEEELIDNLRARMCEGVITLSSQAPRSGQRVSISDGPLCGLEAVFEREMPGQQRVVLLLQALAYQARVVVPYGQVSVI